MSEDDKVRLDHESRDVWLVKVPPRVARVWDSVKEEDAFLGNLRIHPSGDGTALPKITFHMKTNNEALNSNATSGDFNLNFSDQKCSMRIFSKGDAGVEMQGIVEYSLQMQPFRSQEYENMVQKRTQNAAERARTKLEMDGMEAIRLQKKTRIVKVADDDRGDKKRRKIDTAEEESLLREKIFELFARKDEDGNKMHYWTLKDIKRELGTGDSAVRNLLKTLCVYHRDGDFARCYELRPEFKSN